MDKKKRVKRIVGKNPSITKKDLEKKLGFHISKSLFTATRKELGVSSKGPPKKPTTKVCWRCKKTKSIKSFPVSNGKPKSYCKTCWNAYMRDQYNKSKKTKAKVVTKPKANGKVNGTKPVRISAKVDLSARFTSAAKNLVSLMQKNDIEKLSMSADGKVSFTRKISSTIEV